MEDHEKRINTLEVIAKRLSRRAVKKSVALITPFPVSGFAFGTDVRGPILSFMFPCEGTIVKAMVRLPDKPKGAPSVSVEAAIGDSLQTIEVPLAKKISVVDVAYKVSAGDYVTVSINPDVEHLLSAVWVSLLWRPTVKDVEAKSFLIDELEGV